VLLALGLLAAVAASAGPVAAARRPSAPAAAPERLVWPAPPETARIEYERELRGPRDIGASESALKRSLLALAGAKPSESVDLARPTDVYADSAGRIFVSDASAGRLYVFDAVKRTVTPWVGRGAARVARPMGLGGDGRGRLAVTDPAHRRVLVIGPDGELLRALGGAGVLINPVDADLDASGRTFVADSYLHQVVVFGADGAIVGRIGRTDADARSKAQEAPPVDDGNVWNQRSATSRDVRENRGGGPGEFLYPLSVAWNERLGLLAVVDGLNGRVQLFDRGLGFVRAIGRLGDTPGSFARPKGAAWDSEDHLFVVDAAFNNVQVFDVEGRLLLAFGEQGKGPGELWLPLGICVDPRDRVIVADRYNSRLQVYQVLGSRSGALEAPGRGTGR